MGAWLVLLGVINVLLPLVIAPKITIWIVGGISVTAVGMWWIFLGRRWSIDDSKGTGKSEE